MISYNSASKFIFAQTGTENSALNLKARTNFTKGSSDSDFKSVFDKSIGSTAKPEIKSFQTKNDNQIAQASDSNLKFRSFREVQSSQKADELNSKPVKPLCENTKSEEVDSTEEKKLSADSSEYSEQLSALAQMLGISPKELVKLAKDLGFTAQDLKDVQKVALFVQKLGDVLNLSDSQKDVLTELTQEIAKQVQTINKEVTVDQHVLENDETPVVEVKNQKADPKINITKLAEEIKEKLNRIIEDIKVDPQTVSSEVSKVIAVMKAQAKNNISVETMPETQPAVDELVTNSENKPEEKVNEVKFDDDSDKAEAIKGRNSQESTTSEKSSDSSSTRTATAQVATVTNKTEQQQPAQPYIEFRANLQANETAHVKSVFTMPQTVKSSDIINQVVEQAKVTLGQDKTEMVIQMKPDHLGKLELKVVTEQGIVAAKFIAENQQVKEVIETNMQLLKDSLQKQGISIDGVSVQVGHDKGNEYKQNGSYEGRKSGSTSKIKGANHISGVTTTAASILETLPERLAQYSYDSNTINLTA